MNSDRANQILDVAEREMRKGGVDAVSFRDIAAMIGIKSASVHYHFPTKADLSTQVTRRYADRFVDALGSPCDANETPQDRISRLADAYLQAYKQDPSSCLCAVLGAIATTLPQATLSEVQRFYDQLTEWAETAIQGAQTNLSAPVIIAVLQGAMVLSTASGQDRLLNEARAFLLSSL